MCLRFCVTFEVGIVSVEVKLCKGNGDMTLLLPLCNGNGIEPLGLLSLVVLGKELSSAASPETFLTTSGAVVGLLAPLRFFDFLGAMDRHNVFFPRTNIG